MGSGVTAPAPGLPGWAAFPPHSAAERAGDSGTGSPVRATEAETRVADYLRALGVSGSLELELLGARVGSRVEARAAEGELEDPIEAAIEEAHALLLEWLGDELGIHGDTDALLAARAAVLGGAVPGWTQRWAGVSGESLAPVILAGGLSPIPEPAPLAMDPQVIALCCQGLGARLAGLIRRGPSPGREGSA